MNFAVNIEQWRLIDGYDNYEISSHGRVRNNKTSRIMSAKYDNGYASIGLCKNKKRKFFLIHRLVAFAFLEKNDEDIEVDHIDQNRSNNMVLNLRWTTKSINCRNQTTPKNNTSGIKGVSYCKKNKRWIAIWYAEIKHNRSFSEKQYGDQAKQMAIDYRRKMALENDYLNV